MRVATGDDEDRRDATFTAATGSTATTSATAPGRPAPTATARRSATGRTAVGTVEEIRAALAIARPGAVIDVADGEYTFRPRLVRPATTLTAPAQPTRTDRRQASRSFSIRLSATCR